MRKKGFHIRVLSPLPLLPPAPLLLFPVRQSKPLNLYASAESSEMAGGGGRNRQRGEKRKNPQEQGLGFAGENVGQRSDGNLRA